MTLSPPARRDPDATRRQLLDEASRLAGDGGMSAVTLDAVAREAGVSKGGLLHHFPSRRALLDAVFENMLTDMEAAIVGALDPDPGVGARFTRAYLQVIERWSLSPEEIRQSAFWVLMLGDEMLRARWSDWLTRQLIAHAATDASPVARVVRLASDGLWLSDLCAGPDSREPDRADLLAALHAMLDK